MTHIFGPLAPRVRGSAVCDHGWVDHVPYCPLPHHTVHACSLRIKGHSDRWCICRCGAGFERRWPGTLSADWIELLELQKFREVALVRLRRAQEWLKKRTLKKEGAKC